MGSLNNLQTCLAHLWQSRQDYSKFSGDVNKTHTIDVIAAFMLSACILIHFSFLVRNYFAVPSCWLHQNWLCNRLAEEWLKYCSYQVLNKITAPSSPQRNSTFLALDLQHWLAYLWGMKFIPKCLKTPF